MKARVDLHFSAEPAQRYDTRHGSIRSSAAPLGQSECLSDYTVCVSCQLQVAAKKAIAFCDYINRSLVSGSMGLRVLLHLALVKLYLEPGCCEEPSPRLPEPRSKKHILPLLGDSDPASLATESAQEMPHP